MHLFNCLFSPFFQFTRSHGGEKDKVPDHDDSASEVEEGNLSLMDRTKRQALAARQQQVLDAPADGEDRDLEDMIRQTRERVKAAKAAKSRTAALRQELLDLQEEEQSIAASEDPAPPVAISAADPGAFMAASLKSAVIFIFFINYYFDKG